MEPLLNGESQLNYGVPIFAEEGSMLCLGKRKAVAGRCTYFAVGGINLILYVMGSKSTYIRDS